MNRTTTIAVGSPSAVRRIAVSYQQSAVSRQRINGQWLSESRSGADYTDDADYGIAISSQQSAVSSQKESGIGVPSDSV